MNKLNCRVRRIAHFVKFFGAAVVFLGFAGLSAEALEVREITKAAGSWYYDQSRGLSFLVTDTKAIPNQGLSIRINGNNISSSIEITGTDFEKTFRYTGLIPNQSYYVQFIARSLTETRQLSFYFDTFFQDLQRIEMENWDFQGGGHVLGSELTEANFKTYKNNAGIPGVDYFESSPAEGARVFRGITNQQLIGPQTVVAMEPLRSRASGEYVSRIDYSVGWIRRNDWMQYTRVQAVGTYEVYLRCSGIPGVAMQMDEVLNSGSESMSLKSLGWFTRPDVATEQNKYRWIPLTNVEGETLKVQLGGKRTFRFTALRDGFHVNLCLFKQVSSTIPSTQPRIVYANPIPGAIKANTDAVVGFQISNITSLFDASKVQAYLDGVLWPHDRMSISILDSGARFELNRQSLFAFDSTHTMRVIYPLSSGGGPQVNRDVSWTFKVRSEAPPEIFTPYPNSNQKIKFTVHTDRTGYGFEYRPEPGLKHRIQYMDNPYDPRWVDLITLQSSGESLFFNRSFDETNFLLYRVIIEAPY